MPDRKNKILKSIENLEREEQAFLRQHFLAPVVQGHGVRVKIGGVVCRMNIDPADFHGWGVFLPITLKVAMLDRPATMSERRRYLELLPAVRMIVCQKHEGNVLVLPAD